MDKIKLKRIEENIKNKTYSQRNQDQHRLLLSLIVVNSKIIRTRKLRSDDIMLNNYFNFVEEKIRMESAFPKRPKQMIAIM